MTPLVDSLRFHSSGFAVAGCPMSRHRAKSKEQQVATSKDEESAYDFQTVSCRLLGRFQISCRETAVTRGKDAKTLPSV